ncbi:hypothetical protein ACSYGO_07110 [Streptomyces krungchingensis]
MREGKAPPEVPAEEVPTGQVVDLMAALQESVAKAREARGKDVTVNEMPKKSTAKGSQRINVLLPVMRLVVVI